MITCKNTPSKRKQTQRYNKARANNTLTPRDSLTRLTQFSKLRLWLVQCTVFWVSEIHRRNTKYAANGLITLQQWDLIIAILV